jgi:hypothetical protein
MLCQVPIQKHWAVDVSIYVVLCLFVVTCGFTPVISPAGENHYNATNLISMEANIHLICARVLLRVKEDPPLREMATMFPRILPFVKWQPCFRILPRMSDRPEVEVNMSQTAGLD